MVSARGALAIGGAWDSYVCAEEALLVICTPAPGAQVLQRASLGKSLLSSEEGEDRRMGWTLAEAAGLLCPLCTKR